MILRLFRPKSSSKPSSGSTPAPRSASTRSPSKSGSSKAGYSYDLDPSEGYYDDHPDLPPPYYSKSGSDFKKHPVNFKTPISPNAHTSVAHDPRDPTGESPLKVLVKYDIAVVFDDSASMLIADGKSGRTRWEQVSGGSVTDPSPHKLTSVLGVGCT